MIVSTNLLIGLVILILADIIAGICVIIVIRRMLSTTWRPSCHTCTYADTGLECPFPDRLESNKRGVGCWKYEPEGGSA